MDKLPRGPADWPVKERITSWGVHTPRGPMEMEQVKTVFPAHEEHKLADL